MKEGIYFGTETMTVVAYMDGQPTKTEYDLSGAWTDPVPEGITFTKNGYGMIVGDDVYLLPRQWDVSNTIPFEDKDLWKQVVDGLEAVYEGRKKEAPRRSLFRKWGIFQ